MEDIIARCDFVKGKQNDEKALRKDLNTLSSQGLDLHRIKVILETFANKICVQGFPRQGSTAGWMASATMGRISILFSEAVRDGHVKEEACQDCLFDLMVSLLRVGPNSGLYDTMDTLVNTMDMKTYLKGIKGPKLDKVVCAIKEQSYTKENGLSMVEYAELAKVRMPFYVESILGDKHEVLSNREMWSQYLDLSLFYLLHTCDVAEELHHVFFKCASNIYAVFGGDSPYKEFTNISLIKEHIKKLSSMNLQSLSGCQRKWMKIMASHLCNMSEEQTENIWEDLMLYFKALCLSVKPEDIEIIKPFRNIINQFTSRFLQRNNRIFRILSETIVESLTNLPDKTMMGDIVCGMVSDVLKKYKPSKGDELYWLQLLKMLWSIPHSEYQQCVTKILKEPKLKKMWEWKENIEEARILINIVHDLDLPRTKDTAPDAAECNKACGESVVELLKMLKIHKVGHLIMAEAGKTTLTQMEKRSSLINLMVSCFVAELDFQKATEVVPELVSRLEKLFLDKSYPWEDVECKTNGRNLFEKLLEAYKTGKDIPDVVNQSFVRIFEFSMEDGQELVHIEDRQQTLWRHLLTEAHTYIIKMTKCGSPVCAPVLRKFLKFRKSDDENLRETVTSAVQWASTQYPDICSYILGPLIDWFIEEPSVQIMMTIYQAIEKSGDTSELLERWDKFTETAFKDKDSYGAQVVVLLRVSNENPEVFTSKVVDRLMKGLFKDEHLRVQAMSIMMNVTKTNQDCFLGHMSTILNKHKKVQSFEQYSFNGVLVNVAKKHKKYSKPVMEYLLNVVKTASDPIQLMNTVYALEDLCKEYGPQMFSPHKDYIIKRRDTEANSHAKLAFVALVDALEGRSLKEVAKDAQDTQNTVAKLDSRVTNNQSSTVAVTKRVDKQDENLQELGQGLNMVTGRVDLAENDLADTKVKVIEAELKTFSKTPRWSNDLAKLLNPKSDKDWKTLAKCLSYSEDQINAWSSKNNPSMTVLSEWYSAHKTREANLGLLTALQKMNRVDGAAIVENAMKADVDVVEDEEVDYASPPPVFLSYQWGLQNEVKLLRNHLQMAGYECWMDIGQMGGGDKLFEKIDNGIRGAKVIISCVSEKYAASPNCNREVNLSVSLGKPIIPLLMEKMSWPPKGSMGPIFSEYLFIRFFQRGGEETIDDRIWPVAKFQEMLMQLNLYGIPPNGAMMNKMYKNWWIPIQEGQGNEDANQNQNQGHHSKQTEVQEKKSPEIFLSYQWGKQKQIMALYQRLTGMGFHVWMDIHQMGGGDSLYEKIDSGVRGCKVVLTCITQKYSLSANCRREVSLADALKKPIVPLLLEKMDWPPAGPMSKIFKGLTYIYFEEDVQFTWSGPKFGELLEKIGTPAPVDENEQDKKSSLPWPVTNEPTCLSEADTNTPSSKSNTSSTSCSIL